MSFLKHPLSADALEGVALQVAYEGSSFYGWQKTKEGPSIEEELEKALFQILRHEVPLQAASRTDRGVHAKGQVVQFQTHRAIEPKKLALGLNALLPPAIRILQAARCSSRFHPTLDAIGKEYAYRLALGAAHDPLFRHLAWHVPKFRFNQEVVDATKALIGKKDFKAFCNERKGLNYTSTVRTLSSIDWEEKGGILTFYFRGDHFLYKMARNLAGLLVQIGEGKFSKEVIPPLFEGKSREEGAVTAPAHGLCLEKVLYSPDFQLFAEK